MKGAAFELGTPRAWLREAVVVLFLGGSLGVLWNPAALAPPEPPPTARPFVAAGVSVAEARRHHESGTVIVLDVRSRAQFEIEHVPGAMATTLANGESLLRQLKRWIPLESELVLVVGRADNDMAALELASRLRMAGYVGARTLDGGMAAWKKANLPVASGWDMDVLLGEGRLLGEDR